MGANAAGTTLDNTAAATSLANAIILNPSANLTVAGSNPLTLTGTISGGGALTKNGASTLILTADNSYAGGNDDHDWHIAGRQWRGDRQRRDGAGP